MDLRVRRRKAAGAVRVGEEADRILGAGQDDVAGPGQQRDRLIDRIRQTSEDRTARAPRHARGRAIAHDPGVGARGNPAGKSAGPCAAHHLVAHQNDGFLSPSQQLRNGGDSLLRRRGHRRRASGRGRALRLAPSRVCGQDQRSHLARRRTCGGNGRGPVFSHAAGVGRRAHPPRNRPRQPFDVAGERRVILQVIGGVVPYDVDDRRMGLASVMQIGDPVAQTGAGVQESRGRFPRHAGVAVGATGGNAFKQTKNRRHLRHGVQGGHKVHLRCAGIHETGVHARVVECTN